MSDGQKEVRIDVVRLALALQLAVFGVIGLSKTGIEIPIIRQVIISSYLIFIPGILILRLRNMDLDPTKTFLLSFGISLAFVTFISTFVNLLLASAGFERPISEMPLLISISIAVLLLIGTCYFKGKPQVSFSYDRQQVFSPLFLSLLLLPFVSILASYASSVGENDFFVFLLLAVIALIPLIASLDKFPERFYPLVILSSSISLVFLRFGDSVFKAYSLCETGIAGVIKTVGIWVPDFGCTHNSLLYLTILHPVFSILLGIDIIHQVLGIGFIIVFFLPLMVYEIYTKFFEPKTSILASLLFLFYPFHNELLGGRTGFAVFFLALLLLTLFSEKINPILRRVLLICFAFSIITSHYGTAYYFMLLLFAGVIVAFLINRIAKMQLNFGMTAFCFLYFVLAFSWYLYTSSSSNANWAVGFGRNIYTHLSEFLSPESSATMQALITEWGFAQEVTKYLLIANTLFILIGVSKLLYDLLKGKKNPSEYYIFALAFSFGLLTLILPKIMGTVRIYVVSLLLLSPFSFLGFSLLLKKLHNMWRINEKNSYAVFFSILLLLLLLFGSGFVSDVMTKVTNKPFDPHDPMNWWTVPNRQDIEATEWLLSHHTNGKLYIDDIFWEFMFIKEGQFRPRCGDSFNFPLEYAGKKVYKINPIQTFSLKSYLEKEGKVEQEIYIYLGYHNTVYNFIGTINENGEKIPFKTDDYFYLFTKNNKIYDNGISLIWFK